MPAARRKRFYAVKYGRCPGVYENWETARKQVDGFPGAVHKGFNDIDEAYGFYLGRPPPTQRFYQHENKPAVPADPGPSNRASEPRIPACLQLLNGQGKSSDVIDFTVESPPSSPDVESVSAALPRQQSLPHPRDQTLSPGLPPRRPPQLPEDVEEPPLSAFQQAIYDRAMGGENIFFTGSAGTGKSVLLRAIIKGLREKFFRETRRGNPEGPLPPPPVGVTAPTGIAALNIGGSTLHSWAGIGLGDKDVAALTAMVMGRIKSKNRWTETKTLVIDEISMLHCVLLDKLDKIGRAIRGCQTKPFGGIQLIFCGDFFQLPPINTERAKHVYAFESSCWPQAFARENIISLHTVFRQVEDRFIRALENIRKGLYNEADDQLLMSCERPLRYDDGVQPIQLYSRRVEVERENQASMEQLPGEPHVFEAMDAGSRHLSRTEATEMLNDRSRFQQTLPLKVGAQVMLIKNWSLEVGLVNGSMGRVVAFMTAKEAREEGVITTLETDAAESTLEDERSGDPTKWPVVQFNAHRIRHVPDRILVGQMNIEIENPDGEVVATRRQLPLMLAWAITIHKAQGLSLDRVRVDLTGTFDTGQAYVAISRATSLEGLELKGYNRARILTSQRALEWAKEMEEDAEWDTLLGDMEFDF